MEAGKPPACTRWVNATKHSHGNAFIRRRLVARDFCEKGGKRDHVLAAISPLGTLKSMLVLSFWENLNVVVVALRRLASAEW